MIVMEVLGVRVEVPANTPVVVLREQPEPHRVLPILIGSPEASSIHQALTGVVPPRPLTHDLIVNLFSAMRAELDHVIITEIRDHTYYAELHLRLAGSPLVVSSRPSDAIAIAVRTGTAIYATESLLDEAGVTIEAETTEEEDDEAILDEFRDFLADINPEDFES